MNYISENVNVYGGGGQRDRERSPILAEVEVQPHWISTARESDLASYGQSTLY